MLLATLPLPNVVGHGNIMPPGQGNYNTPAIAYDPSDPQRLVAVYAYHAANGTTSIGGSYSADGGGTWAEFPLPGNMTDPLAGNAPYSRSAEPSVAFDRAGNFYITYIEHAPGANGSRPAGAVVLQKYRFDANGQPENQDSTLGDGVFNLLYQWAAVSADPNQPAGADAAFNPYVAVDSNLGSFEDPVTHEKVADKYSGSVYVAWSAELQRVNQAPVHDIIVVGSRDGGARFTTQAVINDGGEGSYPRMVVSQGTADGRVTPGQLNIIWDDFAGSGSRVMFDRITNFAWGESKDGGSKAIADAKDPGDGTPHQVQPAATSSISFTVPVGFVATDVDLEMFLNDPHLEHLQIQLTHNSKTITLVRNGKDAEDKDTGGGITGANMGTLNGVKIGTVFDDQANRTIRDGVGPYVGHFRVEGNAGDTATKLSDLLTDGAGGTWTLKITDYRANADGAKGQLDGWTLRFTSGLSDGADVALAATQLSGAFDGPFSTQSDVMPEQGIGPSPTIASDNTLGSFSPYQGRLYVTYTDGAGDKTDIYIRTSDDGGAKWSTPVRVNDDDGSMDGFSEGKVNTRPHFQPEVAVDQTTGTVVVSFYDARHDASRARVARYLATSIDGAATFGPQTYVNEPNRTTDAITGDTVDLGPIPDNQSRQFENRDKDYSFGERQGLAVVNGRINVAWAGNKNSNANGSGLGILGAVAQIAAGPRIIDNSGTMGPVSLPGDELNPPTADGRPQFKFFEIEFDRPIDPATFTTESVFVVYRDTITSGNHLGVIVPVELIWPVNLQEWGPAKVEGATRFRIELRSPQTRVGTYSYHINPVMRDGIRSASGALGNLVDQDSDGAAGEAAVIDESIGDVYAIPRPMAQNAFRMLYFVPPFDPNTMPIIVPGPHVVDTSAVAVYSARGTQVNLQVPPIGTGGTGVEADDFTKSTITFPEGSEMVIKDLNVRLSVYHEADGDLQIVLIAPDGTEVLLANGVGGSGMSFIDTVFDDSADLSITEGSAPFTGRYRPHWQLSRLRGLTLAGTWTLEIRDVNTGGAGKLYGWSMEVTTSTPTGENLVLSNSVKAIDVRFDRDMDPSTVKPETVLRMVGPAGLMSGPFTITPNPLGTDPNDAYPRTYRIGFPAQDLSGTYTLTLASSIKSKFGDALDSNLNAGVDVLRDESTETLPVTFDSDEAMVIGRSTDPDTVVESYIDILEGFVIKGATVRLNISYPNDPDLEVVLIAPDGKMVSLFYGVGSAGTRRDFTNTVFDDAASTPIQNGAAPFFGRFNPRPSENLPLTLSDLRGVNARGRWTLRIRRKVTDGAVAPYGTGMLNNWSLTFRKPQPRSGLGEPVADQYTTSFRVFTQDPSLPLSHETWTPVGPGAAGGRLTAIAVDPSDPSGNTVYVGAASGGIWKTTNFLTREPQGPTYLPLTDFGPALTMRIGSIAVFARNSDPNQSVVIAGTGEGDDRTTGVGFLLSMDGGATWTLLDSSTNVDAAGNWLAADSPQRNRRFVGTTAYRVVVDPKPTPTGDVIIYAALSGQGGGIWRSLDTGKHWTLMRTGDATDVVLDPNSGYYDAYDNPTGNLQVLYGAFRGDGVWRSPNRGQVWTAMPGGVGVPMIRDGDQVDNPLPVPVANASGSPTGAKGRIVLAKPALTGDPVQDLLYQGWLYAAVVSASPGREGTLDGLYVTKDYGQNWTQVQLPNIGAAHAAYPTNDTNRPDYDVVAGGLVTTGRGNYSVSLAVDPNNPHVVYLGGTTRTGGPGLIRVDITGLSDPHALYTAHDRPGGGVLGGASTDAITPKDTTGGGYVNGYINLLQDPDQPFVAGATYMVFGVASFTNSGAGARWNAFDSALLPGYYHYLHQLVTVTDPVTGRTRLIIADEQGVYTTVDDGNGKVQPGMGSIIGVRGERNGNLQVAQFIYGAVQPGSIAAQAAHALFYASTEHDGVRVSPVDILETGNVYWGHVPGAIEGGTGGVATSQGEDGGLYLTRFPSDNLDSGEFFLWNDIGRTFGLLQQTNGGTRTGDAQWPDLWASNFAVNPIDPNQILISSPAGRIFGTENQGRFWSVIGDPTALDGSYVRAMTYGAPDPNGPGGNDATNFHLYAGTSLGAVYVTFNGGGHNGNNWLRISNGLDGSPIQSIVTNPLRGSHEVYVVTARGVYHMPDSAAPNPTWENITANLAGALISPLGTLSLTSLVADWRYVIPDNMANPTGATHPVLYVGGEAGVFRSLDDGKGWTVFPDNILDGAPATGGYLPHVRVNDLDLALGSIDPTTGREDAEGAPNVLLATTYGRGAYAIRLAPVIVPGSLRLDPASDTGVRNDDRLTKVEEAVFTGISQQTAFGNKVRISLIDMTNPENPIVIGGFSGTLGDSSDNVNNWTDANGRFSVRVKPEVFATDGVKKIGVRATDDAGTVGGIEIIEITLDRDGPVVASTEIDAVEGMPFTGVVASFTDTAGTSCKAMINWGDGAVTQGSIVANGQGGYNVIGTHTFAPDGMYAVLVTIADPAGNEGAMVASIATVVDQPVLPGSPLSLTAVEGLESAVQTVATFTDPGGTDTLDHYAAVIDWGDGQTSAGTIAYDAQTKIFSVAGKHLYADSGTKAVTTTIVHDQTPAAVARSQVVVANVKPVVTLSGSEYVFVGSVGEFTINVTDVSTLDANAGFQYVINWGDGSSPQTIGATAGNGQSYRVAHTFAKPGSYNIRVMATDKDGANGSSDWFTVQATNPTAIQSVRINDGLGQRSVIRTVAFMPSHNGVRPKKLAMSQLKLLRNGGEGVSLAGAKLSYVAGVATLDLRSVNLDDGDYQLQVTLGKGVVMPVDFFKLTGDADGNGEVDRVDRGIANRNKGYWLGKDGFNPNADVDGDDATTKHDVALIQSLLGRSLDGRRQSLSFYPGRRLQIPSLDFGVVKRGLGFSVMDLKIYNGGKDPLRVKGLDLADGSHCSFAVDGALWSRPAGELEIASGKTLSIRIYLRASQAGDVSDQLVLQYSFNNSASYTQMALPVKATIG